MPRGQSAAFLAGLRRKHKLGEFRKTTVRRRKSTARAVKRQRRKSRSLRSVPTYGFGLGISQ